MSFLERIQEQIEAFAEKPLLTEIRDGQLEPIPGAMLASWVDTIRGLLAGRGVHPGDRVALLAPNSARWVAADLGILLHGAISVPLYSRQKPAELAVMLADCEPVLLLAGNEALAFAIREAWPRHCPVLLFDEAFLADPTPASRALPQPEDPVTIVYTSGTSGVAKGAILTRANIDYMAGVTTRTTESITGRPSGNDRVFHFLPFCFMGSRIQLLTQLSRGNPLILSTDLEKLADELRLANPQFYLNVPAILERVRQGVNQKVAERGGAVQRLYDAGVAAWFRRTRNQPQALDRVLLPFVQSFVFSKIRQQLGSNLEFLICGSAPLAVETQQWFQMLGIPIYQVYGLTETTAIITIDKRDQVRAGYVGFPIEGCEVRLTSESELICRGPNVFPGYWNKPAETARMIQDGWLHTGDQAEQDSSGNYRIIGRLKNVLVLQSGHNVPPEPIEERLVSLCPEIKQAVLIGHGKPYLTALLSSTASRDQIEPSITKLNDEAAHYRKIKKFHLTTDPIAIENGLLTANGKLRRDRIEQHFQPQIEAMYQ